MSKRKPSILLEVIAFLIIYGSPFFAMYMFVKWIHGCVMN